MAEDQYQKPTFARVVSGIHCDSGSVAGGSAAQLPTNPLSSSSTVTVAQSPTQVDGSLNDKKETSQQSASRRKGRNRAEGGKSSGGRYRKGSLPTTARETKEVKHVVSPEVVFGPAPVPTVNPWFKQTAKLSVDSTDAVTGNASHTPEEEEGNDHEALPDEVDYEETTTLEPAVVKVAQNENESLGKVDDQSWPSLNEVLEMNQNPTAGKQNMVDRQQQEFTSKIDLTEKVTVNGLKEGKAEKEAVEPSSKKLKHWKKIDIPVGYTDNRNGATARRDVRMEPKTKRTTQAVKPSGAVGGTSGSTTAQPQKAFKHQFSSQNQTPLNSVDEEEKLIITAHHQLQRKKNIPVACVQSGFSVLTIKRNVEEYEIENEKVCAVIESITTRDDGVYYQRDNKVKGWVKNKQAIFAPNSNNQDFTYPLAVSLPQNLIGPASQRSGPPFNAVVNMEQSVQARTLNHESEVVNSVSSIQPQWASTSAEMANGSVRLNRGIHYNRGGGVAKMGNSIDYWHKGGSIDRRKYSQARGNDDLSYDTGHNMSGRPRNAYGNFERRPHPNAPRRLTPAERRELGPLPDWEPTGSEEDQFDYMAQFEVDNRRLQAFNMAQRFDPHNTSGMEPLHLNMNMMMSQQIVFPQGPYTQSIIQVATSGGAGENIIATLNSPVLTAAASPQAAVQTLPVATTFIQQPGTVPYTPFNTEVPFMMQTEESIGQQITRQVSYYFSDKNLETDYFLRGKMDAEGFISLHHVANFPRLRALAEDIDFIVQHVKKSPNVELKVDRDENNMETYKIRPAHNPLRWVLTESQRSKGMPSSEAGSEVTSTGAYSEVPNTKGAEESVISFVEGQDLLADSIAVADQNDVQVSKCDSCKLSENILSANAHDTDVQNSEVEIFSDNVSSGDIHVSDPDKWQQVSRKKQRKGRFDNISNKIPQSNFSGQGLRNQPEDPRQHFDEEIPEVLKKDKRMERVEKLYENNLFYRQRISSV